MLNAATILNTLKSVGLAMAVVVVNLLFQVLRRYTLPNIGYYKRRHGCEFTFFVRNLDSVEYRKPLILRVAGHGLKYVSVQAGPWCVRPPVKELTSLEDTVKVIFRAVPEDAVFIIRAQAQAGDVTLRIHPDSPVVSRHSFETQLAAFRPSGIVRYYFSRYVLGLAVFLIVALGSIVLTDPRGLDAIDVGDLTVAAMAIVVSVLAFLLVVPYKGKRTIGGYESGTSIGLCWPDETTVARAQDEGLCVGLASEC